MAALRAAEPRVAADPALSAETRKRCAEMLEFFEVTEKFYLQMRRMPIASRMKLVKLGSKLATWLK